MMAIPEIARRRAEKRDPLLWWTGRASRAILAKIGKLPRDQRAAELRRVLAQYEPELPAQVQRIASRLHRGGMPLNGAVERAVALGLADATAERFQRFGRARMANEIYPVGGLGDVAPETQEGREAGEIAGDMFRGIACSDGLKESVSDMVGTSRGADAAQAATIGFEVVKGTAQCSALEPIPDAAAAADTREGSLVVPLVVGIGALAVVGGVVLYMRKR
jgi:hypothetical protein